MDKGTDYAARIATILLRLHADESERAKKHAHAVFSYSSYCTGRADGYCAALNLIREFFPDAAELAASVMLTPPEMRAWRAAILWHMSDGSRRCDRVEVRAATQSEAELLALQQSRSNAHSRQEPVSEYQLESVAPA